MDRTVQDALKPTWVTMELCWRLLFIFNQHASSVLTAKQGVFDAISCQQAALWACVALQVEYNIFCWLSFGKVNLIIVGESS